MSTRAGCVWRVLKRRSGWIQIDQRRCRGPSSVGIMSIPFQPAPFHLFGLVILKQTRLATASILTSLVLVIPVDGRRRPRSRTVHAASADLPTRQCLPSGGRRNTEAGISVDDGAVRAVCCLTGTRGREPGRLGEDGTDGRRYARGATAWDGHWQMQDVMMAACAWFGG
jgi:hypothetical protein